MQSPTSRTLDKHLQTQCTVDTVYRQINEQGEREVQFILVKLQNSIISLSKPSRSRLSQTRDHLHENDCEHWICGRFFTGRDRQGKYHGSNQRQKIISRTRARFASRGNAKFCSRESPGKKKPHTVLAILENVDRMLTEFFFSEINRIHLLQQHEFRKRGPV